MCKNFITTKIEKAVTLSCQRIVNVHDSLAKLVQGSILWELPRLNCATTIQANNSTEQLQPKSKYLGRTPCMAACTLDQTQSTVLRYKF